MKVMSILIAHNQHEKRNEFYGRASFKKLKRNLRLCTWTNLPQMMNLVNELFIKHSFGFWYFFLLWLPYVYVFHIFYFLRFEVLRSKFKRAENARFDTFLLCLLGCLLICVFDHCWNVWHLLLVFARRGVKHSIASQSTFEFRSRRKLSLKWGIRSLRILSLVALDWLLRMISLRSICWFDQIVGLLNKLVKLSIIHNLLGLVYEWWIALIRRFLRPFL